MLPIQATITERRQVVINITTVDGKYGDDVCKLPELLASCELVELKVGDGENVGVKVVMIEGSVIGGSELGFVVEEGEEVGEGGEVGGATVELEEVADCEEEGGAGEGVFWADDELDPPVGRGPKNPPEEKVWKKVVLVTIVAAELNISITSKQFPSLPSTLQCKLTSSVVPSLSVNDSSTSRVLAAIAAETVIKRTLKCS